MQIIQSDSEYESVIKWVSNMLSELHCIWQNNPGYEPTQSVKDYSQPLYCKICHVQCNSDSMLETHLNGSKHLKKMKQLGQEDVSTNFVLEDEMQHIWYQPITGSPHLSKCNLVSSETNLGTFLTLLAVAAKTFFEVEFYSTILWLFQEYLCQKSNHFHVILQ